MTTNKSNVNNMVAYGLISVMILLLIYQVTPAIGITGKVMSPSSNHVGNIDLDKIAKEVLPENGHTTNAIWGSAVYDMVQAGVIDINKLDSLLTKRYNQPLTEDQKKLLTSPYSDGKISINSNDAVFKMYILWALAKNNDNPILHNSPFAKYFTNYDIGIGKAGYGDTKLITLTSEQQEIATYVAQNSYRPCCGNPTSAPDCSHGFSLLGLIYLMASQGYSKEEIFTAAKYFNSYWFPSNYIQNAVYFKVKEGKDWNQVDSELVMGKQHSSLSGSLGIQSYLKSLGI